MIGDFEVDGRLPVESDHQSTFRQKRKIIDMFANKCPHCGFKLGDSLYADAGPHCHEVLRANLPMHTSAQATVATAKSWPVRAFFSIVRFVES